MGAVRGQDLRDLVNHATGLLAAGDVEHPRDLIAYLRSNADAPAAIPAPAPKAAEKPAEAAAAPAGPDAKAPAPEAPKAH